ncbi:MAG: hypothetical protein KIT58_15175 [Planctomycetota bacterium]|nr:hypothetical protein [Planctomycetota bacterium]
MTQRKPTLTVHDQAYVSRRELEAALRDEGCLPGLLRVLDGGRDAEPELHRAFPLFHRRPERPAPTKAELFLAVVKARHRRGRQALADLAAERRNPAEA